MEVEEDGEEEISDSQRKKRKVENSLEAKDTVPEAPVAPRPEATDKQKVEESVGDDRATSKKRPLSRQSSQESVRSSSPSSVCSTSTPTRSAQHKKGAEKRAPAKRMRGEVCSDPEKGEGKTEKDFTNATQRRQSRSSSSDSDTSETRKERLLTRSAQSRQETEGDGESNGRIGRPARSSERVGRTVSNNTGTDESGSQTSSVRVTRKSSVPQPTPERKPQSNSVPSSPSQPEVLGKRCSALNAAAKLLAMRGRIDTPGSRKDPAAKTSGQNATSPASSDKNQKSKSKSAPATPQTNCNNKVGSSKTTTPTQSSRTAARSTRQCPGPLVPALETNSKRGSKKEEKEKEKKKPSEGKEESEREARSSRGHSACSSMSSDGGGSSRSQSSSSSLSSQSTGPRRNYSRAPSSGSERERSTERGRRRSHRKEGEGRGRETRKERKERHAQKRERLSQEGNAGSGEGTPDRVLRSVAAMAAAQARTPAANTRSSSAQHSKT
ncbi:micronuclear linker histone polyprotein-like [Salvelinus sp. IW2-2015]|uniref:micronuclear linker histone polyprotein-like n=1 Tax=Salvelinus sp. IW2-2015 TaxID=2691554 RepID=UPI0038D438F7